MLGTLGLSVEVKKQAQTDERKRPDIRN